MADDTVYMAGPNGPLKIAAIDNGDGTYSLLSTGGPGAVIDVTPTLTVAGTYASGDYVGTSAAAMEFANATRLAGGSGFVMGVTLIDGAVRSVAGELWLFNSAPTPPADSAAWSISDADAAKLIGVLPISTYYASALNSVAQSEPRALAFKLPSGSKSIYGCFVTRGAPVYAAGDLVFRLRVMPN